MEINFDFNELLLYFTLDHYSLLDHLGNSIPRRTDYTKMFLTFKDWPFFKITVKMSNYISPLVVNFSQNVLLDHCTVYFKFIIFFQF